MCVCVCVCGEWSVNVCTLWCIGVCVIFLCVFTLFYSHNIRMDAHTHTCAHTHMHTHTHAQVLSEMRAKRVFAPVTLQVKIMDTLSKFNHGKHVLKVCWGGGWCVFWCGESFGSVVMDTMCNSSSIQTSFTCDDEYTNVVICIYWISHVYCGQ